MSDFIETLHPHHLEELLEAEPDRTSFELDLYHVAIRAGRGWILYRRQPNGWLKRIDMWTGSRRSLFRILEEHGIEASRQAEADLELLVETNFRADETDDDPISA